MQQMSSSAQQQSQIGWRRAKILELMSKGETNQSEIARILQVDRSIVCRDVAYLRQQARENISRYVDERLPTTERANYDKTVTIDEEVSDSSNDIQGSEENRSHMQQSTAATTTTNNTIF
jgi:transcriptional regulator